MQPVLASGILEQLASRDLLVALDFDGTLAPIVPDPAAATLRPATRRLLATVAQRYPCAVISGRAEADVLRALAGVTVWYVVGQRGIAPQVQLWSAALREQLAALPGVALEDKGAALAVHYRHCPGHDRAREAILEAARLLEGVRIVPGKEVVNLLPAGTPDKAAAVERVRAQLGCETTLYVGDDESDEAVFALGPQVASVRVERSETSKASYFLRNQEEIDELLERLASLRPSRSHRPEAPRPGSSLGFAPNPSLLPE